SWGMTSESAASGSEALKLIEQGSTFDIAVLDLHMPEMDGITLGQEIRKQAQLAAMPLIMFSSGYGGGRELLESRGNGTFAGWLSKPLRPSQLFATLVSVLAD